MGNIRFYEPKVVIGAGISRISSHLNHRNSMLLPSTLAKLETEYGITHLLLHRNRNQHRVTVWWKYLNMIHRNIRKLIEHIHGSTDARKILDRERHREAALEVACYLLKKRLFSKAYYEFNGIIELGQFSTLGMVLVACLSKLYTLVLEIEGLRERLRLPAAGRKPEKTTEVNSFEEELGEEVVLPTKPDTKPEAQTKPEVPTEPEASRKDDSRHFEQPKVEAMLGHGEKRSLDMESIFGTDKKAKKAKKPKLDKKKKKKSAIDDIFSQVH